MINLDEYQLDEFSISKFKSMKSFWENKRKFKIYDYIISDKKDLKLLLDDKFVNNYFKNNYIMIYIAIKRNIETVKNKNLINILYDKYSLDNYEGLFYLKEQIKEFADGTDEA